MGVRCPSSSWVRKPVRQHVPADEPQLFDSPHFWTAAKTAFPVCVISRVWGMLDLDILGIWDIS